MPVHGQVYRKIAAALRGRIAAQRPLGVMVQTTKRKVAGRAGSASASATLGREDSRPCGQRGRGELSRRNLPRWLRMGWWWIELGAA